MIVRPDDSRTIHISDIKNVIDIRNIERGTVKELFISGCSINNFAFISDFSNL